MPLAKRVKYSYESLQIFHRKIVDKYCIFLCFTKRAMMKMVSLLLPVTILLLTPTFQARPQNVNISQSGNTRISTINGVFTCGEMACPSNSVKCSVSRKTTNDLINIDTVRRCYDLNEVITKEENSTSPNPHPGIKVSDYSEASRTGTHIIQHFNHGDEDASVAVNIDLMNQQLQEWHDRFQQEMNAFNMNFHKEMLQNIQNSYQNAIPKYRHQWN